ncbi:serine/threonine protein kinase, CMGC, dual-specificity [Blastocladiella emersonii ATCC 22665]|nr:serine/threonine protein kinase, CMGC, dual-specificity [Blastocladiella emersonii ATCC 22665]
MLRGNRVETYAPERIDSGKSLHHHAVPTKPVPGSARAALPGSARPSPRDSPSSSAPNSAQAPPPASYSPQDVIRNHGTHLTSAELYEILDFPDVYYWGQTIVANGKKKLNGLSDALPNNGYDDNKGDYLIQTHDHIAYRYEILEILGKGSFGQVVRALDHRTKEPVALKIIRNKKRFTTQGEIEIRILEDLKRWDPDDTSNCVQMTETFRFRNHLCIVFELLSINLYEFIKGNDFRGFSVGLIRRFSVQILNCLNLLWKNEIIHCDLKPENVLLKTPNKSNIKVIDFGSSCPLSEKAYTYIQSRFYRSPEVILGAPYDMAIDMWSLGCILVELYTGYPIFPGENEQDQLWCMMELLGLPDPDLMAIAERKNMFFDANEEPIPYANAKGKSRRVNGRTLAQAVKCRDEQFLDFVRKCLTWDPRKRMRPMEAIHHPWIVQVDSATARGISDVRNAGVKRAATSSAASTASSTSARHGTAANATTTTAASSGVSAMLATGKPPRSLPPIAQLPPPQPSAAKPYSGSRTSYASRALYTSKVAGPGTAASKPGTATSSRGGSGGGAGGGGGGGSAGSQRWNNPQV